MNELETAKAIASGLISAPQRVGNSSLIPLRISGTGLAARPALREMCWRDPAVWLSPDTLARVAGLPIVLDHPKGSLTPDEYESRNIGSILFPYVADRSGIQNATGPDLWGIARLFLDPDQVAGLPDLTTSPSVSFGKNDGNQTITLPDGTQCLCEASPQLIDHCVIVTEGGGVWDKGLPNSGIRSDSEKGQQMTDEEKKAAEAKTRQDAEAGEKIDKMLGHLDDVSKRLFALEKGAKPLNDAAKIRRDAEREAWRDMDPEGCARDDAEEGTEIEALKAKGEPEEAAADAARKSRKDRMRRRSDAMKAAARPFGSAALTAADAEKERQDSYAKADLQSRADSVFHALGEAAPAPMAGEVPDGYRRRLARILQRYSPDWKHIDLHTVADSVLALAETKIYADALAEAASPTAPPDQLIMRTRTNPDSGHRITEFFGNGTTFIRGLKRPSMRGVAFLTPNHRAA